jgi:hypothetical protein
MSRAFVKESDTAPVELPERPISPHPNWVTAAGLAALEREIARLQSAQAAARAGGDQARPALFHGAARERASDRAKPPQEHRPFR